MALTTQPGRRLIDARIGSRVAVRRRELKMPPSEVATAIGLTETELTSREVGSASFKPSEIVQLATVLGVTPGWFFENLGTNASDCPFDE